MMCWSRKGKAYWERLIVLNFFIVEALRYVAKMTLRICHFDHCQVFLDRQLVNYYCKVEL